MSGILLTKTSTFIIGPVATLLGYLMNGIFNLLNMIGIPNIGLSIIIFVIIIYLCMMPLTVKQQKFSKLQAKMNPELQEIRKKYEGKKDNDSMMAMNEETQEVYKKYGVSPTGSCVQLLIQMPILLSLYRVIYNIPAYVPSVKNVFTGLVDKLTVLEGSSEYLQSFENARYFSKQFASEAFAAGGETMRNTFIDVLNKASTAEWMSLKTQFPSVSDLVQSTYDTLHQYNNFFGLNIGDSPLFSMKEAFGAGNYLLVFGALLVPIFAALFQFLSVKLMPQVNNDQSSGNETADTMMATMKTMNYTMPIMSAVLCFTLPAGMGIYWVAGSLIRCIQQIAINRHIDKIDFDELIKKNQEKQAKKVKKEVDSSLLIKNANIRTKASLSGDNTMSQKEKDALIEEARKKNANAKPGSIAAKANMVKDYNENKISK
ncbi:MAG: YidC/Oxa1 family membrane protein insertase [Lachnospiraceae bacterium]|nr:YidC/Oxa1 family membrane protein insertase [Lachnospiraceae bacterium]